MKNVELLVAMLLVVLGCLVSIMNLVVNKFTLFELGTTLILVGLSDIIIIDVKNRQIEALKSKNNEVRKH